MHNITQSDLMLMSIAGHEVLHCIQAIAKQRDTSKMSWSAEHDASFAGQSVMFAAARVPALRDIFVDGCGSSFVWEVRCYFNV